MAEPYGQPAPSIRRIAAKSFQEKIVGNRLLAVKLNNAPGIAVASGQMGYKDVSPAAIHLDGQ